MTEFRLVADAPPADRSDEDLLIRLQAGDAGAAGLLYDRHHRALYAYALSIVRDAALAEDVVHDTFLRVLEFRPEHPVESAKSFLHAVARNVSLDVLRGIARQGDHRRPFARTALARAAEPSDPQSAGVLAALQELPQDQREVVSLKIFSKLTLAQIADLLSVPPGTAASRYRYALEKLAEILSREGDPR